MIFSYQNVIHNIYLCMLYTPIFSIHRDTSLKHFLHIFYEHKNLGHKIWGRQEAVVSREVKEAQAAAASALREACEGKNAQQEICFLFVSVALVASRCVGLFVVGGVVEWDQIAKSRGACANALNGGQDVRCWFRMMVWPIWCLCRPPPWNTVRRIFILLIPVDAVDAWDCSLVDQQLIVIHKVLKYVPCGVLRVAIDSCRHIYVFIYI